MSDHAKKCPECGSTTLTSNGGVDKHSKYHGLAHIAKGFAHGNPIDLAMGVTTLGMRVVNPLKFTCHKGHVFKP